MGIKIAPSILSADFSCLGDQVQQAIDAGAEYIHVDVMDGHFVPNMTVGPLVVEAIKPLTHSAGVLLDTHLMVESPERLIPSFARAGSDRLTVHVETCPHLHRTIEQVKEHGVRAGVTLNPSTPLLMLEEVLPYVDLVLIMSVNPGFGGQKFIPTSINRIARLQQMLIERGLEQVEIEVDGGVDVSTAKEIVQAGATVLVAGTAIFKSGSIGANITALRAAAEGLAGQES